EVGGLRQRRGRAPRKQRRHQNDREATQCQLFRCATQLLGAFEMAMSAPRLQTFAHVAPKNSNPRENSKLSVLTSFPAACTSATASGVTMSRANSITIRRGSSNDKAHFKRSRFLALN